MAYRRRIIDDALDELLPELAAIALEGAKAVGKTATAAQRARTVIDLSDPAMRQVIQASADLITQSPPPVLIDEWQLEPPVWDRVRRAVDADSAGGRFLLTGSAGVGPGVPIHSGAGRIVSLRMRPLSFAERGVCEPTVSLRAVLAGEQPPIVGHSSIGLPGYVDEILRSGFPGIREIAPRARDLQLDSYLSRVVEHELAENGMSVRRPTALRAWLAGYAAATSTDASYTAILDAATAGASDKPVRQTADTYREHLERLFLLDPLPAWIPSFSPLRRLTHTPKHHLVDPALAARLVGVQAEGLLRGEGVRVRTRGDTGTWLGALFESLVVQSVRTYADAVQATVGHLRTKSTEREIDLIVERADRSIVAIEIKLSATVDDKDVRHLTWIREQLPDRVVDTVVINTGEHAYRRSDGVAVIPLALLGP
ncbi:MAG: ATP-binding protein [Candidatus Nanopelagicales bacterium]